MAVCQSCESPVKMNPPFAAIRGCNEILYRTEFHHMSCYSLYRDSAASVDMKLYLSLHFHLRHQSSCVHTLGKKSLSGILSVYKDSLETKWTSCVLLQ